MSGAQIQTFPSLYNTFIGGVGAYGLELLLLGQILDRLKVEQEAFPHIRGLSPAIKSIYSKGGIREFYRGVFPNFFLGSTKGALGWSINNGCYRLVTRILPENYEQQYPYTFAGLLGLSSGIVESVCLIAPLERIKTVQMTSSVNWSQHLKSEGRQFFFRGLDRVIVRQSVNWMAYLVFYQKVKNLIIKDPKEPVELKHKIQVGAGTGLIVSLLVSPFDFLKTQAQKAQQSQGENVHNISSLYKKYGMTAFYNNLKVKMLRSMWSSAVIVVVLDYFQALPGNMGFKYGKY